MEIRHVLPPPGIRLAVIGHAMLPPGWSCPMLAPLWRLYHNRGAGMSFTGAGVSMRVPSPALVLVPAWCRVEARSLGAIDHLFAHADPAGLPGGWLGAAFPHPVALAADPRCERLGDDLRAAIAQPRRGAAMAAAQLRLQALVAEALAEAIGDLPARIADGLGDLAAGRDRLAPALAIIEEDLAAPLDVDHLARSCGIGRDRFAHLFRSCLGLPPGRWLAKRRLAAAAERLTGSADPIDMIALGLGFADRFTFSKAFARGIGCAPAAYRRRGSVSPA